MLSKARINSLCVALVPLFVLLVGYSLLAQAYLLAFLPLAAIVACMEIRVRMGYRSTRGSLFIAHLACAVLFILSLGALAALSRAAELPPAWLGAAAYAALAGMVLSGAFLIRRSWRPAGTPARVV